MTSAFGDQWRKHSFDSSNPNLDLSTGFKYASKNKGWFVSVLSGVEKDNQKAALHKEFVVTRADVDSIKAQVKVRYKMSNTPSCTPKSACKAASKPPAT